MRVAGDDLHLHNEYLRNCWYVAAWAHELIDGKLLARTILDQPILLYKGDSGARWRSTTVAATVARGSRKAASKATACAACTTG